MNTLDITISCGLTPKKVSTANGGEYHSPCPMCGGTNRFHVWPGKKEHGSWWCRGCRKSGDAVQLLIEAKGMTFKEACDYLGKRAPARRRGRTPVAPRKAAAEFIPRQTSSPAELWQQKAAAFAGAAHEALLKAPDQLAWLAARGITGATARRFRLGWNATDTFAKRSGWGLTEGIIEVIKTVDIGPPAIMLKKQEWLWLPAGLVIPYWQGGGEDKIHRLRIRRPEGEPRYYIIPGSGSAPMMISSAGMPSGGVGPWIIVESELDAILLTQDAGDLVSVAALGSSAIKPDGLLYAGLRNSPHIINALDADTAGGKAWAWWAERFPQASRWPVPRGKDPGDYRKDGGDVRAWVLAGLPYGLRPAPPVIETSQLDKKACLPEGDPDALFPMDRVCPDCGRTFMTWSFKGDTAPYRGPCADCLERPGEVKPPAPKPAPRPQSPQQGKLI